MSFTEEVSNHQIRVSVGTASLLGLNHIRQPHPPKTAYLLMDAPEGCFGGCAFCPQSQHATFPNQKKLSRIQWPVYPLKTVIEAFKDNSSQFNRICIQAVNKESTFEELILLVKSIRKNSKLPLSLSLQPFSINELEALKALGVNRVGIPIDAATPLLFQTIKGSFGCYTWEEHFQGLFNALQVFGPNNVSTHIIIGLGETEQEVLQIMEKLINHQITVGLFAFTPIPGTKLEHQLQPPIDSYRRIQLARYLLMKSQTLFTGDDDLISHLFEFQSQTISKIKYPKNELKQIVMNGQAFQTSGCPGCNRPYYNERPGRTMFNYPRPLTPEESLQIWRLYIHDIHYSE